MVGTRHPIERGEGRGRFAILAEAVSNFASGPAFFVLCVALVSAWLLAPLLGISGGLRNELGQGMTAVTLLLLAVLKNSERRAERAIQLKLDAIAGALLEADAPAQEDRVRSELGLEQAIGLHDEV